MKLVRTIYSGYINPALIENFYVSETLLNGEEGYTVEATKGDSSIPLYFTDSKDVADAYLLWLVGELGGGVNQWNFEGYDEKLNTRAEEPAERTAHWDINCDGYYPYCSNCLYTPKAHEMAPYCSRCGAKMVTRELMPQIQMDLWERDDNA